jgi:CheY-like chemotaxis protein
MPHREDITLLLVDDDPDDRYFLSDALFKSGFNGTVEEFKNGEELLNRIAGEKNLNGLVVLDLNMPIKNGYDTLKEIRNNNLFDNLPVVILSATSKMSDKQICKKLGCNDFFEKPMAFSGYRDIAVSLLKKVHQIR